MTLFSGLKITIKLINTPCLNMMLGNFTCLLTKEYILISEDNINTIKHHCKSELYYNEEQWIITIVRANLINDFFDVLICPR